MTRKITANVYHVFIGWEKSQAVAAEICRFSILKYASGLIQFHYLKKKELIEDSLYLRVPKSKTLRKLVNEPASTEFALTRFWVPHLMEYEGNALYCDCSFLWTTDIVDLFKKMDKEKAVYVVPHDRYGYKPRSLFKMENKDNIIYEKKNWSSMMLFNCSHEDCVNLDLNKLNTKSSMWLHQFSWTENIGFLEPEWNFLAGYYKEEKLGKPKAINYTDGGPWLNDDKFPPGLAYVYQDELDAWQEKNKSDVFWRNTAYAGEWADNYNVYRRISEDENLLEPKVLKKPNKDMWKNGTEDQMVFQNDVNKDYESYFLYLNKLLEDPDGCFHDEKYTLEGLNEMIKHRVKNTIVGVSGMEDLSPRQKENGMKYDGIVGQFIKGANGYVTNFAHAKTLNDKQPVVFRGIVKRNVWEWCKENNRDYFYIDTGYFGNIKHKDYHRVTKNNLQYLSDLRDVSSKRFERTTNVAPLKKFTPGSKVLVCPPSAKAMKFYRQADPEFGEWCKDIPWQIKGSAELDKWTEHIQKVIKENTDRPVEIRLKQGRSVRTSTDTMAMALEKDVHCLVTYNSIAAVEALMNGKPAFTLGPNAGAPLCLHDLTKIDDPYIPSVDEVFYLCCNLAYQQFSKAELFNGQAWKLLQDWYGPVGDMGK